VWVPLLDTKLLSRLASGRKTETYFPVAVADGKFHCIILKGGDQYPYFPRPLLSEFDFEIPLSSKYVDEDEDAFETTEAEDIKKLEGAFVLQSILTAQHQDLIDFTTSTHSQRAALAKMEIEIDKILLQMVAVECIAAEERGMRALEMVTLLRDKTGRMIEGAGKVAERYDRTVLGEKIKEIAESRLFGDMDED
jgi:chromosome transmission fidelity protein 4